LRFLLRYKARMDQSFDQKVWQLISEIPRGKVTTYKLIAAKLRSKAYRAVGGACNRSPGMPKVPCHRVVTSSGFLHGFAHGIQKKKELLEKEGVRVKPRLAKQKEDFEVIDLNRYLHRYRAKNA
jgi:methylated-DNA-[protein]-cysteine S-methyltransferase